MTKVELRQKTDLGPKAVGTIEMPEEFFRPAVILHEGEAYLFHHPEEGFWVYMLVSTWNHDRKTYTEG